jgi:hypothetical protein
MMNPMGCDNTLQVGPFYGEADMAEPLMEHDVMKKHIAHTIQGDPKAGSRNQP